MDITVNELKKRLEQQQQDFVLLDVREPYEHEAFNVGGTLIPIGDIMQAVDDLQEHQADEIVIYCRSGNRSGMAQQILQQHGFSNVRNLIGGMLEWQRQFGK